MTTEAITKQEVLDSIPNLSDILTSEPKTVEPEPKIETTQETETAVLDGKKITGAINRLGSIGLKSDVEKEQFQNTFSAINEVAYELLAINDAIMEFTKGRELPPELRLILYAVIIIGAILLIRKDMQNKKDEETKK